ncbi:MAG: acetyltransferase [Mycobacterium pseudokansasii]|uniref:Lysine N-acyltransferase MbtK n=1 Tax=Mycobacterium pseudokansasii TaxID=2341080 RepID=A0A498QV63_9MYCO|nr:GNAT family N-acetyltransferase [Mycobacterium pseudokansasii]KZS66704.1 siderophore biosynthesis protein [Mycobacterium kansasii]MBY0387510.1 acetyltransferase [Mycobacterium pseudokansasii]VAZ99434.1 Lysine N-acyltransferase MbtK [Mycobacterium pseudokansasii]VBA30670.1 Lysine N-acyltransferase MbtK [Mycobacterium pseudokansasii]VBA53692.1 Lysine N-acyltransferase MbtK [Mycobacterium pseudokansasii]
MSEPDVILPRELTDLPDEVRNIPPPPAQPEVPEPYAFRLADPDADADMIAEWMRRPHLAEAWEYVWPVSRWQRYLRAQLDSSYSRPMIGSIDGQDHAYVELYWAAKDSIATRYEWAPYDLGIHAGMADPEVTNKGIAQFVLPHLVASMLNAEPRCRRVMFDPDYRNKIARRFCERAGCVFLGEHDMANRRMALYALPRTPDDVPRAKES